MFPASRALFIPIIVACALFMENVDSTILVTALPVLARDLGVEPLVLKLAVTSYVVGLGVFIPICGWVADRFGSRTVFKAAIGVFVVGSMLCAASQSLLMLVAARLIQGIGGAMMVPVGRIIIFRAVPRDEFIRAVNYLTIPALAGPVVGPLLGGFITTYLNWRLMFFINVPIGLLGIYLTIRYIPNSVEPPPGRLDMFGFVTSGLGAALLMLGLSLIGTGILSVSEIVIVCLLGVVSLLLYVMHAYRVPKPLLDLRLFKIPTFNCSVIGGALFRMGLGAMAFLLPLILQEGLGKTAFQSGVITCSSAVGAFFMKTIAMGMLRRFGFRSVLYYNAALCAVAVVTCGLFHPGMAEWLIWAIVLLGGFFPSLQWTALNALAYADIESGDVGRATSLASVVQQMALGFSVAMAALVLQASHDIQGHATIVWTDFWPAFLAVALFAVASMPITARMPLGSGGNLAHR